MFRALGDPTRRAVLHRLCGGTATVSELAAPFKMALPSFLQHLDVLTDCGLIRSSSKKGRVRTYKLHPDTLKAAEDWLSTARLWEKPARPVGQLPQRTEGAVSMTPNPKLDLVLERVVDIAPELIWKAWTTPEFVAEEVVHPGPVEDGRVRARPPAPVEGLSVMESPEGQRFPNTGCFLEVEPNRKLVWTDALGAGVPADGPEARRRRAVLHDGSGDGWSRTAPGSQVHGDRHPGEAEEGRVKHEEMGFHQGWGAALDQTGSPWRRR